MLTIRIFKDIFIKYNIRKNILCYKPNLPTYVLKKNFSVRYYMYARVQLELENRYAYSIMEGRGYAVKENIQSYFPIEKQKLTKDMFASMLKEDWARKSPTEIFSAFLQFGVYCNENNIFISDKIFDTYIDNLTDNIKFASDKELENLFVALLMWPQTESVKSRNFIEVWAALDDECLNRYKDWTFGQMLQFVSRFYMLGITRMSDYCIKCIRKLASKVRHLAPEQAVQTFFFIGLLRKAPIDMHNLELYVIENFVEFSIDELAIISMGFFKSKTPIRSLELVKQMVNKVREHSKTIQHISLVALLKIIRYSFKIPDDDYIYALLDTLHHELPRLNVLSNVHIALLGTSTLTLHEPCLNMIAENIINSMDQARIKDLERIVLTFGIFNFKPATKVCFFEKVINELRKPERQPEIHNFGRAFACCLSFLKLLEIYPEDLIAKALSKDFLQRTYGKYFLNYGREILTLNNIVEIYNLDASIPRLKAHEAVVLAKKFTDYMPTEDYVKQYNITEKFCLEIMKHLETCRGGREYVLGDHILPHHQRGDLIICNDKNGKPLPVHETLNNIKFGQIKTLPDDNNWIALVIAGRNVIIPKYNTPSGQFYTKIRELRKLGYKSSLILWSNYSKLESNEEKISYINDVIQEALENKEFIC